MDSIFSGLLPTVAEDTRDFRTISAILRRFPRGFVTTLARANCTVRPLARGERYDEASPELERLGIDCDLWPAPPAGLFVVQERTVYLRSRSAMTVAHECAHALDCALGNGVYRSGIDTAWRRCFLGAKQFITPYAATGIDEFAAENFRAYVEINDPASHWPKATRGRLKAIDPATYELVERTFAEIAENADRVEQMELVLR